METKIIQDRNITGYKSDIYLGMKAEEAKEQSKSIFKEFTRMDTNYDGIISFEEITAQRDKKHKKKNRWANIFLAIGAYNCYNGFRLSRMSEELISQGAKLVADAIGESTVVSNKSIKKNQLIFTLAISGFAIYKKLKSNNIQKETQEFRKSYFKQMANA